MHKQSLLKSGLAGLLACACQLGLAADKQTIQNIGSDTMVNLAQAWAEAYHKVDPSVSVEVFAAWFPGAPA